MYSKCREVKQKLQPAMGGDAELKRFFDEIDLIVRKVTSNVSPGTSLDKKEQLKRKLKECYSEERQTAPIMRMSRRTEQMCIETLIHISKRNNTIGKDGLKIAQQEGQVIYMLARMLNMDLKELVIYLASKLLKYSVDYF